MDAKEAMEIINQINEKIGSDADGEIENITTMLVELKDFLGEVDSTKNEMDEAIEQLNKRCEGLRHANNKIMRQLNVQETEREEENEETLIDIISGLID